MSKHYAHLPIKESVKLQEMAGKKRGKAAVLNLLYEQLTKRYETFEDCRDDIEILMDRSDEEIREYLWSIWEEIREEERSKLLRKRLKGNPNKTYGSDHTILPTKWITLDGVEVDIEGNRIK